MVIRSGKPDLEQVFKNTDFYLDPLANPFGLIWYSCQPMGQNKFSTFVMKSF